MEDVMVFRGDNTGVLTYYSSVNNECVLLGEDEYEWKNEGGLYYIKYTNSTDLETGGTIGEDTEEFELFDITFSDDNNQFERLYKEDGNDTAIYKDVYQRQ